MKQIEDLFGSIGLTTRNGMILVGSVLALAFSLKPMRKYVRRRKARKTIKRVYRRRMTTRRKKR